ncbi:MAG TPA: 1,4-alpha-glucan branching protein GlgB [Gemmatimonadaceae bacterium]|nr:1,4-alpha-glucan branching protein GlgB [Gemmatimonadaceae bacterium]
MAEKKKPTDDAKPRAPRKKAAPRKSAAKKAVAAVAAPERAATEISRADIERLINGDHASPHSFLGAHPLTLFGEQGAVVRTLAPNAKRVECVLQDGRSVELERIAEGLSDLYQCFIPGMTPPFAYRLRFTYHDGAVWERDDPYRFLPTVGEMDLHLFNEGTHRALWKKLGAHVRTENGVSGVSFAVWAPNAKRVSVVGDFCGWDGRIFPMRMLGSSGVWELFVPEIQPGALYKFELLTREGLIRVKTDPFAAKQEQAPGTASIVQLEDNYEWSDNAWMSSRRKTDLVRSPLSIYEVHLGSWARVPEDGNRALSYRGIAPRLAEHVRNLGFTHVELMPIMEHPFYGSWGYQVSGYYAPTSRYGTPDDFRYFVDVMHQHGIGVILDWVPAHFPKDDYALRRFDGTALYEHEDPRLGEHPDWGTLIFNYGRNEVRNFLVANALYWLNDFHCDGLRVDAVASMLYLDYSRKAGQWIPNAKGGRENLEAIDFLRQFTETVAADAPGCVTIAEESTAWPGVTTPVNEGGLGFTFKWNMGWMHDTLAYFARDPVHRRFHQDRLTFAMLYEYSERFIMPLSHDEVVHLKGSLLHKMPGDDWQKLANLRVLYTYMFTRPGKKLLFMGSELAPWTEWNHDTSLDWHLRDYPGHAGMERFVSRLASVYKQEPAFWREDHSWDGFSWIDVADKENSVVSYVRRAGDAHAVVVLNLTPVPRERYRIGVPSAGPYRIALSSDDAEWGGGGYGSASELETQRSGFHGYEQSLEVTLPPLAALILKPAR